MCGIAGFVRLSGDGGLDAQALPAMLATIRHRGPDGQGEWTDGGVHLGHRRLSIIDIDQGAQPMVGESGCVIVFNGEIYNYRELRDTLEKQGQIFKTHSDTEVLLRLYELEGPDCLEGLIGMFAFVIWDPRHNEIFLARDRLGKKPLYTYHENGLFAFASEVKALIVHPEIGRNLELDERSIADFLALGYILSPKSIFKSITRLPAANYLRIPLNQEQPRGKTPQPACYWDLASFYRQAKLPDNASTRRRFLELLNESVRIRLRSDVPLGTFLSGGIDSASVAACMKQYTDKVRAYSIGFEDRSYDETADAQASAKKLGIDFSTTQLPPTTVDELDMMIWYCDEPFADTSLIPTYLLSKVSRKHVTVALSGDGADEILAGYPTYAADKMHAIWGRFPKIIRQATCSIATRLIKPTYKKVGWSYKLRKFLAGHDLSPRRAHYFWREIFNQYERDKILSAAARHALDGYDPFDTFEKHFDEVSECGFLDQCLYVDIKTWLQDDILVKVDRMSMANSLELRSPFMDHRLVEFCARLPARLKLGPWGQKAILRECMASVLPQQVLKGAKRGFGAPTRDMAFHELEADGFEALFVKGYKLDPLAEDVTYKSFVFGALGAWLRIYDNFKKDGFGHV